MKKKTKISKDEVWDELVRAANLARGKRMRRVVDVASYYNLDPFHVLMIVEKAIAESKTEDLTVEYFVYGDSKPKDLQALGIQIQSGIGKSVTAQFFELTQEMEGEWKKADGKL